MNKLATILTALALATVNNSSASVIVGPILDPFGQVITNSITFKLNQPVVSSTNFYYTQAKQIAVGTNGQFSVSLTAGKWTALVGSRNDQISFTVPNDTNTYSIAQLLTNGVTFATGLSSFLQKGSNLTDVGSASAARTALGLGSASLLASSAVAQTANNGSDFASKANTAKNVGPYPLNANVPTVSGSWAQQPGVSPNGYFYWWNGSSWQGQWGIPGGLFIIGDQYAMPAGMNGVNWFFSGNPADQTPAHVGDDNEVRVRGMNPFSRSGYSINMLTTNFVYAASLGINTNFPSGTNSLGTKFWELNVHAASFITEHYNGLPANLAGSTMIVNDNPAWPFYITQNTTVGSQTGDYPFLGFDGSNGIVHFQFWNGTTGPLHFYNSTNVDVLKINLKTKVVDAGAGSTLNWNPTAGQGLNISSTGVITLGGTGNTGTVRLARYIVDDYTTLGAPGITVGVHGGGNGFSENVTNGFLWVTHSGAASGFWSGTSLNQLGAIYAGSTGATGHASAILQADSTTKGLLPPRMTKAQRNAISSPATGLVVWQTDSTPGLRSYNGTHWVNFTESNDD